MGAPTDSGRDPSRTFLPSGEALKRHASAIPRGCLFTALVVVYFNTAVSLAATLGTSANLGTILVLLSTATLQALPFVALQILAPRSHGARAILWLAIAAIALASAIDFIAWIYFQERLGATVLFVLLETNARESIEFVKTYAGLDLMLVVLFLATPWLARALLGRIPGEAAILRLTGAGVLLWLALTGASSALTFGKLPENPVWRLMNGIGAYKQELNAYHELRERLDRPEPVASLREPSSRSLQILVLGESTARGHMSLYGYERLTTPRLDALRDELIVFEDVISPHSHTIAVLQKLLTTYNQEAQGPWYRHEVLFPILRSAGFKTWWISNQEPHGLWVNAASAIGATADVKIFHNRRLNGSSDYDGALIAHLEHAIRSDAADHKYIVLHLQGTHIRYADRYPEAFGRFDGQPLDLEDRPFVDKSRKATIDAYDNAVLYGDHVIAEIIEVARRAEVPSSVVYLSDHGEEVYDFRDFAGHTEALGSSPMVEIPFLVWFSPETRADRPELEAALRARTNAPYSTDDAIHTLLDLADVHSPKLDPRRSLAGADFDDARPRFYSGRAYRRDAPIAASRGPEKIWAHRVNSTGKLRLAQSLFAGVEVDLVFENGRFDVNHPPAESIGLDFEAYLGSIGQPDELGYWLDIKNMSSENAGAMLGRLEALVEQYGLDREKLVVESPNTEALAFFDGSGFRTSFYLPAVKPETLVGAAGERYVSEVVRRAELGKVDFLSFPGELLPFVNEAVSPRLPRLRLLTWLPRESIDRRESQQALAEVTSQENLGVVLVGYHTSHDR